MNKVTIRKTKPAKDGTRVTSFITPTKKVVLYEGPAGAFMVEADPSQHIKFVKVPFDPTQYGEDTQYHASKALAKKETEGWVGDLKCMTDRHLRVGGTHQLVVMRRSANANKNVGL